MPCKFSRAVLAPRRGASQSYAGRSSPAAGLHSTQAIFKLLPLLSGFLAGACLDSDDARRFDSRTSVKPWSGKIQFLIERILSSRCAEDVCNMADPNMGKSSRLDIGNLAFRFNNLSIFVWGTWPTIFTARSSNFSWYYYIDIWPSREPKIVTAISILLRPKPSFLLVSPSQPSPDAGVSRPHTGNPRSFMSNLLYRTGHCILIEPRG